MFSRVQRWFGNGWEGILELLITVFCVFFTLSVRGFAQGYTAYKMGDPTAKYMGRLNINPINHIDPIGAICMFLFGFGWVKPVPVNPGNFKPEKRKSGMIITALSGPAVNLIVAFAAILLMRIYYALIGTNSYVGFVFTVLTILTQTLALMNISYAVFTLIPIPPLDGSKILNAVLPARIYFKIMQYEQYGFLILIILINTPLFSGFMNLICGAIWTLFNNVVSLVPFL